MIRIGTNIVKGPGTPLERLRIIKDAGFDYVWFGGSLFEAGGANPELCDKVGIAFDNVHLSSAGATSIWSPGEAGEAIVERYCREIPAAAALGVRTGIIHVTWGRKAPMAPGPVGFSRYDRIAECADKYGFRVAVENSAFPEQFYAVLDRYNIPAFAYCFDSGHRNAFTPTEDYLAKYGDRLAVTHLHDNDGANDLHILPFDGTIDWEALARSLAATPCGREKISAEISPAGVCELHGMSADDIRNSFAGLRVMEDDAVSQTKAVKIGDGYASFYEDWSYERLIGTLFERMKRLAGMIEKNLK